MDYYHILRVSKGATIEQIKVSYRSLAKLYHPDMCKTDKKQAESNFKSLSAAYQVLGNLETKAAYDRSIGNFSTGKKENVNRARWNPAYSVRSPNRGPRGEVTRDMFNVEMWNACHYGDEDGTSPFTVHSNGWVNSTGNKHQDYYRKKYAREWAERHTGVKWSADSVYEPSQENQSKTSTGTGAGNSNHNARGTSGQDENTARTTASQRIEKEAERAARAKERSYRKRPGADNYGMTKADFLGNEKHFLSAVANLERSRQERKQREEDEKKKNTTDNTRTPGYDDGGMSGASKKDSGSCTIS